MNTNQNRSHYIYQQLKRYDLDQGTPQLLLQTAPMRALPRKRKIRADGKHASHTERQKPSPRQTITLALKAGLGSFPIDSADNRHTVGDVAG